MDSILDPFLLSVPALNLACPDEAKHHLKVMGDHQRRVQDWLLGDVGEEALEEGLFEVGVEPDEFWGVADQKISDMVATGSDVDGINLILRPEPTALWY